MQKWSNSTQKQDQTLKMRFKTIRVIREAWYLPESRNCRNRSLIRASNPRDVRRRAAVCGTA